MPELAGYVAVNSLGPGPPARAIAIARELQRRHPDVYPFFLAGSPALDLAVSHGFDAMPMPPTPEWFHEDGRIRSMWRWYWEYARYVRLATRFLGNEVDWYALHYLIMGGDMDSVRFAVRRRVPT